MNAKPKTGAHVFALGHDWNGNVTREPAKVIRKHRRMMPLPDGYVPIRFDSDGAVILSHFSRLEARHASA